MTGDKISVIIQIKIIYFTFIIMIAVKFLAHHMINYPLNHIFI